MPNQERVAGHYTHGSLLDAILAGLEKLGKTADDVTLDDLGPVEEFHIGGRQASADFLDQLNLQATDLVLDVGCGLGGVARFTASRYGSRVTGLDLTEEFVRTGQVINTWLELDDRIGLEHGSATAMTYPDGSFDKAYMMHVGMNIEDKHLLMRELHRVLKPGGRLGVFDIMRFSDDALSFPVPWASEPDGSALATPDEYKLALEAAGFEVSAERNRHAFAMSFFERLRAGMGGSGGPPPLGLHIVLGADAAQKTANMVENVGAGRIAPVELIAEKRR